MSALRKLAPFAILVALNVLFRLPALLNANGVHSDAAIVGLQAMHILKGETSRFLWGAGYQGSFDAWAVAALFALGGPSALKLMLAPFVGHLLLCFFAWLTLSRRLSARKAMLVCLPLVFTPQAINGVALYAPRQWCLTFLFAAIWLLDQASATQWWPLKLALGLLLAVFSTYLDLYGLQVLAPVVIFFVFCAFDAPRSLKKVALRLGVGLASLAAGYFLVSLLRSADGGSTSQTGLAFSAARVAANWPLFKDTCLPWVLSAKVFVPGANLYPDLWVTPAPVRGWQLFGAGTLLLGIALAPALALVRRVPWEVSRLGLLGAGAAAASMLGFLLSGMPYDMWAARYLAPIVWLAPFALAPLALLLTARGLGVLLAPYLSVAALGGWLSFGHYVNGPLPRLDARGQAGDELQVLSFLRSRKVQAASAQYWLSYRLTFLFEENPIVVPLNGDRYRPYRDAFNQAATVAYVFHPSEPRATPEQVLPLLLAQGGRLERAEVSGFTVLIHERRPSP
jgi:hypothetical protein